ncbi:MAG: DUF2231 domain-containing protein [Actinomycetota bacterium]
MFDTVFGLPLHTLVVHAVVVLVPLAALGTVAIAAVPSWRARFGVPVLLLTVAAVASVPVAVQSGYAFLARLARINAVTPAVLAHQQLGRQAVWFTLPLLVFVVLLVVLDRRRRAGSGTWLVTAVALFAVVAAGVATYEVVRVGHAGSTAVWRDLVRNTGP